MRKVLRIRKDAYLSSVLIGASIGLFGISGTLEASTMLGALALASLFRRRVIELNPFAREASTLLELERELATVFLVCEFSSLAGTRVLLKRFAHFRNRMETGKNGENILASGTLWRDRRKH